MLKQIYIVLGSRDIKTLKTRMDIAIDKFKSSPCEHLDEHTGFTFTLKVLLLSGGRTDNYNNTEAYYMEQYAINQGINQKFIHVENESINTLQSLKNCNEIINYWFFPLYDIIRPENVTICTSTWHIKRVMLISKFVMPYYNITYEHTKEVVTIEENYQENYAILHILDLLLKTLVCEL